MRRDRLWLLAGPFLFGLADVVLTLHGQSAGYYRGERTVAREGNPPFRWFLRQHPLAFAAGAAAWSPAAGALILTGPPRLTLGLTLAVLVGHTLGAWSWLVEWGWPGWTLAALGVAMARLWWGRVARLGHGAGRSGRDGQSSPPRPGENCCCRTSVRR